MFTDFFLPFFILQIALKKEKTALNFKKEGKRGMVINNETMRNICRKISTTSNAGTTELLANDFL